MMEIPILLIGNVSSLEHGLCHMRSTTTQEEYVAIPWIIYIKRHGETKNKKKKRNESIIRIKNLI